MTTRFLVLWRDGRRMEITEKDYRDLALPGAGAPPGVDNDEWITGRAFACEVVE